RYPGRAARRAETPWRGPRREGSPCARREARRARPAAPARVRTAWRGRPTRGGPRLPGRGPRARGGPGGRGAGGIARRRGAPSPAWIGLPQALENRGRPGRALGTGPFGREATLERQIAAAGAAVGRDPSQVFLARGADQARAGGEVRAVIGGALRGRGRRLR